MINLTDYISWGRVFMLRRCRVPPSLLEFGPLPCLNRVFIWQTQMSRLHCRWEPDEVLPLSHTANAHLGMLSRPRLISVFSQGYFSWFLAQTWIAGAFSHELRHTFDHLKTCPPWPHWLIGEYFAASGLPRRMLPPGGYRYPLLPSTHGAWSQQRMEGGGVVLLCCELHLLGANPPTVVYVWADAVSPLCALRVKRPAQRL